MGNDTENIKILCIGVGGAGTNVINRMKDIGIPNAEFLTFGGYRYDYSHPEIPHYNLIEVNEIDSLPNGSGTKVFERLANNVADCIFVFFCIFAKDLGTEHNQRSLELIENRSRSTP